PAKVIELKDYLTLDMFSKRNLELTETILKKTRRGSLLWVLDRTMTSMGSRLLKKWLDRPLLNKQRIEERLEIVDGFYKDFLARDALREMLKAIYELEILSVRVAIFYLNARDLIQLKQFFQKIHVLINV